MVVRDKEREGGINGWRGQKVKIKKKKEKILSDKLLEDQAVQVILWSIARSCSGIALLQEKFISTTKPWPFWVVYWVPGVFKVIS